MGRCAGDPGRRGVGVLSGTLASIRARLLPLLAEGYLPSVRTSLLTLLLTLPAVLAACGPSDRRDPSASGGVAPSPVVRGPDNLVLRVPRAGGTARVFAYPRLDTVVWSNGTTPAPSRVLGFDNEAGTIAYVDAKGQPARIDFRQGSAYTVSRTKLTGLTSADGNAIFGIAADGGVERFAPGGTWRWKAPLAARALFPQMDGTLLVLGERPAGSIVWRIRPPASDVADSVALPRVDRTLRTQVGDRIYLASGSQLTGVRTRGIQRTPDVDFTSPVEVLAATPSGDRVFVVTRGASSIEVVDRYQERVTGKIEVGRNIAELRVDPLGRYLLARPEGRDSAVVIALGTNRVIGALPTSWRSDLPFVAPDGGVALAQGADVIIADGETLKPSVRVRGGAGDFWFAFQWNGFRPRAASLDRPVEFDRGAIDSLTRDSSVRVDSAPPVRRDSAARRAPAGFTVSFAALLASDKANELAAQIHVGGESARVVTAMRDGATIFRVVMGPYATRAEAERVGRESRQSHWIYEGAP